MPTLDVHQTPSELQSDLEDWCLNDEGLYRECRRIWNRCSISLDDTDPDNQYWKDRAVRRAKDEIIELIKTAFPELADFDGFSAFDWEEFIETVCE